MNCALHKTLALQYFCQTCQDPVCAQCIKSNPHSNEFHQILTLQQAVQIRKHTFNEYVQTNINPVRQKMREKLQELKQLQAKQVDKRNVIMKDIMLEFEAIDQRTKEKAEKSTLQHQTEIKYYQGYLNSLDDLAYTFDNIASDPYNFLILYQDFSNQLKSLQLKQIKERIENFQIIGDLFDAFGIDQTSKILQEEKYQQKDSKQQSLRRLQNELRLPREIKTTFQQVSKLSSLRQRNSLINTLIASACENYQRQQKKSISDSEIKYKNKLHTFNHANQNIIKLNACNSCAFCGLSFTLDTVNDQCSQNKSAKGSLHEKYLNVNVLPEFRGTKRHYWVDSSLASRNVPDLNAHQMLRPAHKRSFMNSLNELYVVKCCFRKYEIDHAKVDTKAKTATIISFMKVFEDADKENKGVLSKITFKYLLTKTFEMNQAHGDILTQLLSYNWMSVEENKPIQQGKQPLQEKKLPQKLQQIDRVNYKLLKDFMQNPLFPYQQWQKIQQQNDKSKPHAPKSQNKGAYKYGAKW